MHNYQIITVSNRTPQEWYYLQEHFYESLKRFGKSAVTIDGKMESSWRGLSTKPKWLYNYIKGGFVKADYIQFVDNWDLIYGQNPDEVMSVFDSYSCDIVISAEKNCFPGTYKKEFDAIGLPKPYSYLNSGVIVGRVDAIMACLEAMDLDNVKDDHWVHSENRMYHSNDQEMWQDIFLKQPVKISLDCSQDIAQSLHDAVPEDFDFSGERIKNIHTTGYPRIWHFNGGSKDNMALRMPILNHLKF